MIKTKRNVRAKMDEVKRYLLCLTVLPAIFLGTDAASGTVTMITNSVIAVINDSTFFNCSTSSDNVEWLFDSNQYPQPIIYSYGKINAPYQDRFRIENYTNSSWKEFNLIHLSVTEKDAGRYICRNPDRLNEKGMKVHLTVLDTEPTCAANWSAEGVIGPNSCGIEPETIQLSCSVRFTGNKAPTLTIRKLGEDVSIKLPSVVCSNSGRTYTCNLTMNSTLEMDGSSYVCQTTESTTNQYSCTSETLRILYVSFANSEINATVDDKENCTINSSQPCNYTWKFNDSKGVPSESYGQDIDLKSSGTYICEAICPMRDKHCTTTVKTVVVSPQNVSEQSINHTALSISLPFIAVGFLIVLSYCTYSQCKRGRSKQASTSRQATQDETGAGLISAGYQNSKANLLSPVKVEVNENLSPDISGFEVVKGNGVTHEVITPAATKRDGNSRIRGLTLLKQQLFVATARPNEIEVYDCTSKMIKKTLWLEGLIDPGTIASCVKDNCIYLIDKKNQSVHEEIFKFSPDGEYATKWSKDVAAGRLSVIEETGHVVLAAYGTDPMLKIFSAKGELINTIDFPKKSNIKDLYHAVQLRQGGFVVSHGSLYKESTSDKKLPLHRVCKIGEKKNILKSFGGERGSGNDRLCDPSCLIETADQSILVADMNNHRVLLLSKDFKCTKVLFTEDNGIKFPEAMYFDETNNRLYVACNLERGKHGRVICLDMTNWQTESETDRDVERDRETNKGSNLK